MIIDETQNVGLHGTPLELVWRNPLARVKTYLRTREKNNAYCEWAKQATKIRARRSNWDASKNWVE
jgi:hypothetical protein